MEKEALNNLLDLPKPHFEPDLTLDRISLNPFQPRDPIRDEDIEGMKAYIRSGILEPIIVHRKGEGFELIAGERRLRAAKALGMTAIPAMIYPELTPGQVKMISLQENLGRKDLDWLEIARGYQVLADEGLTHEQIAGLTGVSKSTVTHRLSLLGLPEEVKKVGRPTFLEGHAAALLQLETPEEQIEAFREWQKAPVTVKSFRKIVKRVKNGISTTEEPREETIVAKKPLGPEKAPTGLSLGEEIPEETERPWPTTSPAELGERSRKPAGRSRQWQITRNFLLSFSRNPENGRWRVALEARPRVMIQTALAFVGLLVIIFGARMVSDFLGSREYQIPETRQIVRPEETAGARKAVSAGKEEVELQQVHLYSEPYWAKVWVDEENVGNTPLSRLKLPIGPHVLFLENPEKSLKKKINIEVVKGNDMRVTVYLMNKAGEDLKVEHMVEGAWKQVYPVEAPKGLSSVVLPVPAPVEKKPAVKKPAPVVEKKPEAVKKPTVKKTAQTARPAAPPRKSPKGAFFGEAPKQAPANRPVEATKELSSGGLSTGAEKKVVKKSEEKKEEDVEIGVWKDVLPELKKKELREEKEKALLKGLVKAVPVGSPVSEQKFSEGYGYIYTAGIPSADYTIDGKKWEGATPIQGLRLRAGKHRFRYENPKLGVTKEFEIEILKGKTLRVNVSMNKPPGKDLDIRFINY